MPTRTLALPAAVVAIAAIAVSSASARFSGGAGSTAADPPIIDDATLKAITTTLGGAEVLPTTRTIPHWWGSSLDPHNGLTYGYNMVGADPTFCVGPACSTTIEADITPILVTVGGRSFDGDDVLVATFASPSFEANDYGSTPHATAGAPNLPGAPGAPCRKTTPAICCSWKTPQCGRSSATPGRPPTT